MDKLFAAKDGNIYLIEVEHDGCEINVSRGIRRLGQINLDYRCGDTKLGQADYFHITHLSLGKCKRLGIGRACLEFHKELYDCPLTAGYGGSGQAEDGSHLTGDGPGFIAAMRALGIVLP